jgi:hypothetical protein
MPLGEPTTWQQEMGGGGPRPRVSTLLAVMVVVVVAAVVWLAPVFGRDPVPAGGDRRVGPACVELARLERRGADQTGVSYRRARLACLSERAREGDRSPPRFR